jgi:hypothetical protein
LRLEDVVMSVEIINEANGRNVLTLDGIASPVYSGLGWGHVAFHCARAFRDALDAADMGRSIPLLLPSLASYHHEASDGVTLDTWADSIAFVEALAGFFSHLARHDGREVSSLAQGIDYHWYFTGGALSPRHILHLVSEVAELRHSIRGELGVPDAWVTVSETGTSITKDGRVDSPHQARELWRRFGGALASDARAVAWHAWMGDSTDEETTWAGFGLRNDLVDGAPTAHAATPRLSWGSYVLLARHLPVSGGRVLHPAVDAGEDTWGGLVILEYRLPFSQHAYLFFVDPTDVAEYAVTVRGGVYSEYPTLADVAITYGAPDELPLGEPVDTTHTIIGGKTYTIGRTSSPVLVVSTKNLTFTYSVLA